MKPAIIFSLVFSPILAITSAQESGQKTSSSQSESYLNGPSSEPSSALLPDRESVNIQKLFANMNRPAPVTPPMVEKLQKVLHQAEQNGFSVEPVDPIEQPKKNQLEANVMLNPGADYKTAAHSQAPVASVQESTSYSQPVHAGSTQPNPSQVTSSAAKPKKGIAVLFTKSEKPKKPLFGKKGVFKGLFSKKPKETVVPFK